MATRKPMDLHLKKGAMHRDLGKKQDSPITQKDIEKEKAKGGVQKKRAIFAENARKWKKG